MILKPGSLPGCRRDAPLVIKEIGRNTAQIIAFQTGRSFIKHHKTSPGYEVRIGQSCTCAIGAQGRGDNGGNYPPSPPPLRGILRPIAQVDKVWNMALTSKVQKSVNKIKVSQQTSDFAYWQTQPYEVRLITLEQIRQEYHRWKYGTEPRLQRVYSITKRT